MNSMFISHLKKAVITGFVVVGVLTAVILFYLQNATDTCKALTEGTERDECYKHLGIEQNNPSFCEKVLNNDLFMTGQPKDYFYIEIARHTKDERLCERVSAQADTMGWNNRNACYTTVAVLQKNISLCENITHPQQKETCIRSVTALEK